MAVTQKIANGVLAILDDSIGVQSLTVCVTVKSGAQDDDDQEIGLAHLLEHVVLAAAQEDGMSLSTWVDSVGGQSNASTSQEALVFWARVPPDAAVQCVARISTSLTAPRVTSELCAIERSIVIQELLAASADPVDVVEESFHAVRFVGQRLGRPVGGTAGAFPEFGVSAVIDSLRARLCNAPVSVGLVGPSAQLDRAFSALAEGPLGSLPRLLRGTTQNHAGRALSSRMDVCSREIGGGNYAYLAIGGAGAGRNDPMWAPFEVLAAAVGGIPSSLLYRHLRDELGLGYTFFSRHVAYDDTGAWYVIAGTENAAVPKTKDTIVECLRTVATGRLSDQEFCVAKTQAVGAVLLDNEDPVTRAHLLSLWARDDTLGGPLPEIREKLEAVTFEQLRQTAVRVLDTQVDVVVTEGRVRDAWN